MRRDLSLFWRLLIFRLIISFLKQSIAHADEFWQALEPAYVLVYGKGQVPYDWVIGLRSYFSIFPYIFGMLLAKSIGKLADVVSTEYSHYFLGVEDFILWNWHKIVAAFIAATMDLYAVKIARRYFGWPRCYDRWVLFALMGNAAWFVYSVRIFSNNLEGMFSLVALYMWPLTAKEQTTR